MEPNQKPSVGRVVHYSYEMEPCAGIITKVWNDACVNIAWFDANGNARNATSVVFNRVNVDAPRLTR
jgi:hypothetical protein